jgi:hypothetical protein
VSAAARGGGRRTAGALAALAFAALLAPAPLPAAGSGEARFNVEVPAGQWKGLRVKNLPQGTRLAVEARSSAALRILVLDEDDLRRMPAPARPLFEGMIGERLSFSLEIPRRGHYYVVLDNRGSDGARRVQLLVRAAAPAPPPGKQAAAGLSAARRRTPAAG